MKDEAPRGSQLLQARAKGAVKDTVNTAAAGVWGSAGVVWSSQNTSRLPSQQLRRVCAPLRAAFLRFQPLCWFISVTLHMLIDAPTPFSQPLALRSWCMTMLNACWQPPLATTPLPPFAG